MRSIGIFDKLLSLDNNFFTEFDVHTETVKSLSTEIGISLVSAPIIWCDNQSAAALASNPKFHSRTKYIELDVHFLREKVIYVPRT